MVNQTDQLKSWTMYTNTQQPQRHHCFIERDKAQKAFRE